MTSNSIFKWAAFTAIVAGTILMMALAGQRGSPGSLLPHGYCFTWNPALLWTHVTSDALIGLAYVSIPVTLLHLVRKRSDIPFGWMALLFATFIVSCGATHWIEVWTVWHPDYWLSGNVKAVTAIASVLTAIAFVRLVPSILAIPTISELNAARAALEEEVKHRRSVEEELRKERAELEQRVLERTNELAEAMRATEAARADAEEANRQKDRFLAKVSHELRTPLQSSLAWAQLLTKYGDDPARIAHASARVIHNVRTQARLIDDLLDISRILSGKLSLELQTAEALPVIEKAVDVVRTTAAQRHIIVDLQQSGPPLMMFTDPTRLEQVVWNLVSNAVHSSADGGKVQVNMLTEGDTLVLTVQDWGRGIEADMLTKIFEPFQQGTSRAGTHRGLGLGLAITQSIVTLFGGRLQAYSEGLGLGARFEVSLPSTPPGFASEAPTHQTPELIGGASLRGLRILYVEDDPDIGVGCQNMLMALGAEVELCQTFDQALQKIEQGGFELLLSDLNLDQGHTALELLSHLQTFVHLAHVPAVVLSAYGSKQDRDASMAAGFVAHLVKPVASDELAQALLKAATPRT